MKLCGSVSPVVVLPRGWLDDYGLKKGDKVELITNGKITIQPLNRRRR